MDISRRDLRGSQPIKIREQLVVALRQQAATVEQPGCALNLCAPERALYVGHPEVEPQNVVIG